LKFHDCGDWWPISFLSSSKQPRDQEFSARRDEDGHPDKWPAVFPKNFIPAWTWRAVACPAGGDGGRRSPEHPAQFYTQRFWFRLSQCRRGVLFSHSQYKLGGKALHTIRKTRRCHTPTWRRAQNAVCPNGVGHDGDGPNAASSDASNLILASGGLLPKPISVRDIL